MDTSFAFKFQKKIFFALYKNITIKIQILGEDYVFIFANFDFRRQFLNFVTKKVLSRDICFAAKTKKTLSKKAILGKTKTTHLRYMESSKTDVLRFSKT